MLINVNASAAAAAVWFFFFHLKTHWTKSCFLFVQSSALSSPEELFSCRPCFLCSGLWSNTHSEELKPSQTARSVRPQTLWSVNQVTAAVQEEIWPLWGFFVFFLKSWKHFCLNVFQEPNINQKLPLIFTCCDWKVTEDDNNISHHHK